MDLGAGRVPVRLVGQSSQGIVVVRCPLVKELASARGSGSTLSILNAARLNRVWGRAAGEAVLASETAMPPVTVPASALSAHPIWFATPPHIPPLITVVDTEHVLAVETALVRPHELEPLPTTLLSTVLTNMRELVMVRGKVTKQAQAAIRAATIDHALSLRSDDITRMMTVTIRHFGLHKLFSLDIGDVLDVTNPCGNEVGYVCTRSADEAPVAGEPHPRVEAAELIDTVGFNGVQLNKTDAKGNVKTVRYLTFAEHPEHDNEFAYNLASECALD